LRSQRLAAIVEENENAARLRTKTLNHVLYGKSSYGYSSIGTDTSNKSMARADLVAFWKRGFVPSNAALVVAGDLTEAQLRSMAEKYFSSWSGGVFTATPPETPKSPERTIYIVDKPHAPQTSLAIGTVGVARSTPDFVPLQVMNSVFGGQFSSRLNMNLREEHGYTYGAHSSFGFRRGAGPFSAWGGIRTNVTAPAVTELFREVRRIRETAPTEDELRRAKDSWSLSLAGDFETTSDIATTEGNLFLYQLPFSYYATLADKIEAVTATRVQEVANRYLNPDKMVVVAVGDRAQIEPELRKLDLGNVEIVP
jgi:zinc protease